MRLLLVQAILCQVLIVLISSATGDGSAKADVYRLTRYSFDITGLSPGEVESAVIAESENPSIAGVPDDAHPVLARWHHSPCFAVLGNDGEILRVQQLMDLLSNRTGVRISRCEVGHAFAITVVFSGGPATPEDRGKILHLFGSAPSPSTSRHVNDFLAGRAICYSNADSGQSAKSTVQPADPSLQAARILINTSAVDETVANRCLFLGILDSLGLFQPQGLSEGIVDMQPDQWDQVVELNLLGVFIVYSLDDTSARGTRQEVASAIRAMLHRMHSGSN